MCKTSKRENLQNPQKKITRKRNLRLPKVCSFKYIAVS